MAKRHWLWMTLDIALGGAALGGVLALLLMPATAGTPTVNESLPELPKAIEQVNERRELRASIDWSAWSAWHAEAGLPEPGTVSSIDAIPVRRLVESMRRWADTRDVNALGEAGETYLALEDHRTAIRFLAAATALAPQDARWIYLLGCELQAVGEIKPAISAMQRAIQLDAGYATAHARLGELHLESGELMEAEASFRAYQERAPSISLGYVGLGRIALARGDAAAALELFSKAVQMTPNDFLAWRLLSRAAAATGASELAVRAARQAERLPIYRGWLSFDERLREVQLRVRTQTALENELRAMLSAGPSDQAIELLEELLSRRPMDANVMAMLARARLDRGEPEAARRITDEAIALEPASAPLHALLAMVHITADSYEAAHFAIDDALRLDPGMAAAWELRGRTLMLQRNWAEAAEALERAVELDPGGVGAMQMLAMSQANSGNIEGARGTLEAILELKPSHGPAREMLQRLDRATGGP